jgi:hypothetical protein
LSFGRPSGGGQFSDIAYTLSSLSNNGAASNQMVHQNNREDRAVAQEAERLRVRTIEQQVNNNTSPFVHHT